MFKDKQVAREISQLMLDVGARLDESLAMVQAKGNADEFQQYKQVVASIMGEMLLEVMNPIFLRYPDLKPSELK